MSTDQGAERAERSARADGRCPACGAPGTSRSYRVEDFDLYRCTGCRTEFLVPRHAGAGDDDSYWDGYKFEIYGSPEVQAEYDRRYRSILAEAEQHLGRPVRRIVDVGCGIGNFLEWAGRNGYEARGVDVEDPALDTCRERGLEVCRVDELPEHPEFAGADVVTMWDVIEHIDDPLPALRDAVALLAPGGLVVMETPDAAFPVRPATIAIRKVIEPLRWSDMLYFVSHRTYFTSDGINRLLERSGMQPVRNYGMRSPSEKMSRLFDHWAEVGSGAGRLGPRLYQVLDATMRRTRMTNKLIVIARKPAASAAE